MKNKDKLEKIYFSNKSNFADIFNYYLFKGKKVIKEENLIDKDKELIRNDIKLSKMERDLLSKATIKYDNETKKTYIILGIENQSKIDYKMVIRVMGYDYFTYNDQIEDIENSSKNGKIKVGKGFGKSTKLIPVITLVIYYGTKKWDGAKDLYSLLDIDNEDLKKYIPNYFINLIEPYNMTDDDINKLNYNNQAVFELIKYSNDKDKMYELYHTKYGRLDRIPGRLINEVTKAGLKIDESEGEIDMCKAIDDMRKESEAIGETRGISIGKAEGKAETLNENIVTMHKNGFDAETIARALSLDLCFVRKVLNIEVAWYV